MPVRTPGPTTSRGAAPILPTSSSYAWTSWGTLEPRQTPSSESTSSRLRQRTPSSSPVRAGSVASRQFSVSILPSNRPSTVCVFPTSTVSSATARAYLYRGGRRSRVGRQAQKVEEAPSGAPSGRRRGVSTRQEAEAAAGRRLLAVDSEGDRGPRARGAVGGEPRDDRRADRARVRRSQPAGARADPRPRRLQGIRREIPFRLSRRTGHGRRPARRRRPGGDPLDGPGDATRRADGNRPDRPRGHG